MHIWEGDDCPGADKYGDSRQAHSGAVLQQFTHLPEVNVVKLPDNVSFTDGAGASLW